MKKLEEGDKMANFNLNEYLKEKHSEIMACKEKEIAFEYDERAVEAGYKLVYSFLKKVNVRKEKQEDFVQDCILKLFTSLIYKWEPSYGVSIVTYAYASFWNMYKIHVTKEIKEEKIKAFSLDGTTVSSHEGGEDELSILDIIPSTDISNLDRYILEEEDAMMREYIEKDDLLYKYYIERRSQMELANEYGCSRSNISMSIKSKLNKIRKEINEEKVTTRHRKRQ